MIYLYGSPCRKKFNKFHVISFVYDMKIVKIRNKVWKVKKNIILKSRAREEREDEKIFYSAEKFIALIFQVSKSTSWNSFGKHRRFLLCYLRCCLMLSFTACHRHQHHLTYPTNYIKRGVCTMPHSIN